jgi:hypothetical protein
MTDLLTLVGNFLINTRLESLFVLFGAMAGASIFILFIADVIMPSLVKDIKDIASKQPLKEQWRLLREMRKKD